VRGLEAVGISAEEYGKFLIPVFMAKLPPEVRLQIARASTKDVWQIDELIQAIRAEVEARELSEGIRIQECRQHEPLSKSNSPSAAALVIGDISGSQNKYCVYCRGEHYSASCGKVKDMVGRREVLRREGRCFLCLSSGHCASDCSSSRRCRHCGRRHHQSLCGQNLSRPGEGDEHQQTSSSPAARGNTQPPPMTDRVQTAGTQSTGDSSLQTSVTVLRKAKNKVLL